MSDETPWTIQSEPDRDLLLDSKSLRALTHPVRVHMLNILRSEGPSTATRLAQRLGLNSGATSYHLRRLESGGFIKEDPDRGNGRDRWWRAAHRATWYDPSAVPPEERDASAAYLRAVALLYAERMQRAVDEYPTLPQAWLDTWMLSDYRLRLTATEHGRLLQELLEVIGRYRREDQGSASDAPDDAEQVVLQLQSFVLPGRTEGGAGP